MPFDAFNYLNCMVEALALLLFWQLLDGRAFRLRDYLLSYAAICLSAGLIVFINASGLSILLVNFLLVFLSMWAGFRRRFTETAIHALFSFLLLLYLQCIGVCLLPQNLMGTNRGNLFVNLSVVLVGAGLLLCAKRYHWGDIYRQNQQAVWLFLLVLCVPEIVIAQFFASLVGSATLAVMVILLLLQLLYMTLVGLLFFILRQKANRRHWEETRRHLAVLNAHLEESRQSVHDFNKHIRYLRNAVTVHTKDEECIRRVDAYCEDLLGVYEKEEILLQLEDPIFRALLYGRRTQAQKQRITFYLDATGLLPRFPLKDYQFVEVFDNLMDNAFECVAELPEKERWIRVTLQVEPLPHGKRHLLCVENPCSTLDMSAVAKGDPYTTKGGAHQGVGLRKVSRLVGDTGGKVILSHENRVFAVKITYDEG